jgi:hypothetical protein
MRAQPNRLSLRERCESPSTSSQGSLAIFDSRHWRVRVLHARWAAPCPLPKFGPGNRYHTQIRARDFTPPVTNAWFPLTPGTVLVYTGDKDQGPAIDIFAPTRRTKVIDGVRTRVVEDRLYTSGFLAERTSDYYAQDRCGNVWYFGEDTAELNRHGKVTRRSGSFHGVAHGAQPGVFIQAQPQIDREFRQELAPGQAEDKTTRSTSQGRPPCP